MPSEVRTIGGVGRRVAHAFIILTPELKGIRLLYYTRQSQGRRDVANKARAGSWESRNITLSQVDESPGRAEPPERKTKCRADRS